MGIDTVNQWLFQTLEVSQEKPAVVFGAVSLSYAELDAFSNRVANYLMAEGVEPGDKVGLCLDRSIEMVAVLIGILKAGAAYVPLDPAYPLDRLCMMAEDARLKCSVVHSGHMDKMGHLQSRALVWETIEAAVQSESASAPGVPVGAEDLAYIIFTSGSTGRPKGIEMPHRALANLIEWQLGRKTFRAGANVLQYSSISFDVSFQEISTTLASGGTLHLISNDDRKDPRELLAQLMDQKIARLFLPYVAMRSMIEVAHMIDTYPVELKETITAGEQLRVDDWVRDYFSKIGGASLDNQYGPSETHVITAQLLEGDPSDWPHLPSIGTPLPNCAVFILNEKMEPVPEGEQGELFLAGRNLAQGYIGREDLTAKAFVPAPAYIKDYSVLYKTGDLAAFHPDGSIEFLGRRDHQIKILGHRIEPGEINTTVSQLPSVGHCLTHAFESSDGVLRLTAYYTVKAGESLSYSELRQHLETKLPDYMVPAFLIELDEIPYTPSGKVDLKALPRPSIENSQYAGESIRYETPIEEGLAAIWSELLGLEGIPRTADFFELGGDSLRAVTLFLKIQQRYGRDFPLATLFQASTIEALAKRIEHGTDDPFADCRSLKQLQPGEEGVAPLFLVHGGAGNILCFSTLAQNLETAQPVYAFQWSGWDGGRGENGIEEMAQAYCNELLKHFPDTPVRIGGYCIGGYIAMELMRLLKAAGVEVLGPLLIFDAPNLRSKSYHSRDPQGTEPDYRRVAGELAKKRICNDVTPAQEPQAKPLPWLKRTAPYALARAWRTRSRLQRYDRDARNGSVIPVDERNWYCAQTQTAAIKKHRAPSTDFPVLYFRSECCGADMLLSGWWSSLYMGFDEVCRGPFLAHIVGGGHGDILDHPKVAERVKDAFQSLEGDG